MKTKELTNIPELAPDVKVTIWKMNFGMRSDAQAEVSKVDITQTGRSVGIDVSKMQVMTLVYGIYESADLGIKVPSDLDLGLTDGERTERLKIVRRLEGKAAETIYNEINELNQDAKSEVIKK